MFGYVRCDMPNLYVKDLMLYKALYCGLCKSIGASCGQIPRLGLSYDMTFLSAIFHNLMGTDIKIEGQNCFEHAIGKRPIAVADALSEELGALNTILLYAKLTDDIEDGEHGRAKRFWFRRGFRRARKKYPALADAVDLFMEEQRAAERAKTDSLDRAADPTACMMQRVSRLILGERGCGASDELFYSLGKWIYLIDALDDYDKDKKKGRYNPFLLSYGSGSREELMKEHGGEVRFLFDTLFFSLREGLAGLGFAFNRDLTDNILLRGLPLETERVMRGEKPVKTDAKV